MVEKQAAYLLVALRQKILNLPQTYARRMVGLKDAAQASKMLREMAISVLNEIKDLPSKVVDRDWLEKMKKVTFSRDAPFEVFASPRCS